MLDIRQTCHPKEFLPKMYDISLKPGKRYALDQHVRGAVLLADPILVWTMLVLMILMMALMRWSCMGAMMLVLLAATSENVVVATIEVSIRGQHRLQ